MTKLDMAMSDLHDAESQLVLDLERMGERHHADHEVVHITRDLARWSTEHLARLAGIAPKYGLELSADSPHTNELMAAVREKTSDLMGRRHAPALMLLDDLRDLYGAASRVQLDWEVLAQAAQALEDTELVELAESCRTQSQRQVTWAETKLKETAAQALVTP
jgi:hypothetical protein